MLRHLSSSLFLLLAASCAGAPPRPAVLDHVGDFTRRIATTSPEAQRLFDQGLLLCYGFDHEEAVRLFRRALEADPSCAMAHWGIALAMGPNINHPGLDADRNKAACEAIVRARQLVDGGNRIEFELIEALATLYTYPPSTERGKLDQAYAAAMRRVHEAHPQDDDVATLFAEAMMDLRPWDLWQKDGKPQPGTEEILSTLHEVLQRTPDHPGALHYTIHALEASPHPEFAVPAADRLCNRVPGASHLVHMPSHIYIRVGRYHDAVLANQRAVAVDQERIAKVGRGGFYAVYRAHNYHFLMWAAMFDGQSQVALQAARDTVAQMPAEVVQAMPEVVEGFLSAPLHAMVRFGRWQEILKEPPPDGSLKATTAFWHYARALALSALLRIDEADTERQRFETAAAAVPGNYTMGNNSLADIFAIARPMVEGEIEYRRGHFDRAFTLLRQAVTRDDELHYDEPWGWVQPARHALGALLLEQDHVDEAMTVYGEDLARHPDNGWSLHGLAECLRRSNRSAEAEVVEQRLATAWQYADIALKASCYCRLTPEPR